MAAVPEGRRVGKATRFGGLCAAAGMLFFLAHGADAQAQTTFKCSNGGTAYYSDRPCPLDTKTTAMTPTLPQPVPTPAAVDTRNGHLAFLSAECRRMNEELKRLQAAQDSGGGNWETRREQLSDLEERYRGRCAEEESLAWERLQEMDRNHHEQQRSSLLLKRAQQERVAAEREQCAEMRRIRQAKRQQLGAMSPGEKADFQRFETAFVARCEGVAPR
jgi:hypothetical protein